MRTKPRAPHRNPSIRVDYTQNEKWEEIKRQKFKAFLCPKYSDEQLRIMVRHGLNAEAAA